jgi:tetratricopeptide (TPR) repeat protein
MATQALTGSYNAQTIGDGSSTVNVHTYNVLYPLPVDAATLDAALAQLDALPLACVPDVSPLPSGSLLGYAPNPYFVGRQDDLKHLARALKIGGVVAVGQVVAATGLGGIGKTQLASEFAHRYGRYFAGGVFWMSFASPDSVPGEIARCGGPGGLALCPDFECRPQEEQVLRVLSAWQSGLPRLLVFDNCEDEALLAEWRPPTGGCRVLLTSRRAEWDGELVAACLPLGVLPRAESVALLGQYRPDLAASGAALDAVAAELGDLPLALRLAGGYLYAYRHDPLGAPEAYLAELRQPGLLLRYPSLCAEGQTFATAHARHVARSFALSYERLDARQAEDALALKLLARAACFAPGEAIPRALLLGTLPPPEDPRARADALRRLAQLGLIECEDDGGLRLHRLLAAFVRQVLDDPEALGAVESHLLDEAYRLNQAGYPAPLSAWQIHLQAVAEAADARGGEWAADLLNALGYHLWTVAAYAQARAAYQRSLAIAEQTHGPEHPAVAIRVNNLGSVLQDLGDWAGAQAAFERALAIGEQAYGPDHPQVAIRVNNLGLVLRALGDWAGAKAAFERALAIDERAYGPDHPDVAIDVNNLGLVLQALGEWAGAKAAFERALSIDERAYGPDHPKVAIRVNNLGSVLRDLGDWVGAKAAFERALAIGERAYGPDHPQVAIYANNLGSVLRALGDWAGAQAAYGRALAIDERAYGPDHPDVAIRVNNLGSVLEDLGDWAGAQAAYGRALAILARSLGPDHPNTRRAAGNLEALAQAQAQAQAQARPKPRPGWRARLRRWFSR